MKKTITMAIAAALTFGAFAANATDVNKTYLRKGTQEVRVFTHEGKLYCRRVSDGFELCHGMEETGVMTWTGDKMKHPDMMPNLMTFDGTVIIGSNKKMSIEGCMVGGAFCDQEVWDEQ